MNLTPDEQQTLTEWETATGWTAKTQAEALAVIQAMRANPGRNAAGLGALLAAQATAPRTPLPHSRVAPHPGGGWVVMVMRPDGSPIYGALTDADPDECLHQFNLALSDKGYTLGDHDPALDPLLDAALARMGDN